MYQKITLVGNLGRDPNMRYTPQGNPVTNFSLAVNQKRGDDDVTTWFRVTAWGKLAEVCNQYLSKGRQVLIEGELTPDPATGGPRVYQRNDGSWASGFEVRAHTVKFLGGGQQQEPEQQAEAELPF